VGAGQFHTSGRAAGYDQTNSRFSQFSEHAYELQSGSLHFTKCSKKYDGDGDDDSTV
jgi:hypothetical protein